jgi:hypothetical protein
MFENMDKVKDRTIAAFKTGLIMVDLLCETSKPLGKKHKYNEIDDEVMDKSKGIEYAELYKFLTEYHDILNKITDENNPKKLVGPLKTSKEWVG